MSLESLSIVQRLALSYAPRSSREAVAALLMLDERLASILRDKGEVMIAQIKLAWWRDRLGEDPASWPEGEPLLERLRAGATSPAAFQPLVNGWERLLDETLSEAAIEEFAQGRALAWSALCGLDDDASAARQCARQWALADLALNLGETEEAAIVRSLAFDQAPVRRGVPKSLRPLAVLHALCLRALKNNSPDVLDGGGAAWLALRTGLFGR